MGREDAGQGGDKASRRADWTVSGEERRGGLSSITYVSQISQGRERRGPHGGNECEWLGGRARF